MLRQGPSRLLALLAVVVLATTMFACGDSDDDDNATADTTPAAAAATSTAAPCRKITHQLGTACVPANPQRIVALDSLTVLPTLLDLNAPVVGATAQYATGNRFPTYIDTAKTSKIEIVGLGTAGGQID